MRRVSACSRVVALKPVLEQWEEPALPGHLALSSLPGAAPWHFQRCCAGPLGLRDPGEAHAARGFDRSPDPVHSARCGRLERESSHWVDRPARQKEARVSFAAALSSTAFLKCASVIKHVSSAHLGVRPGLMPGLGLHPPRSILLVVDHGADETSIHPQPATWGRKAIAYGYVSQFRREREMRWCSRQSTSQ